jgi:glycosyltransferase involved in cell wall biosynthesis
VSLHNRPHWVDHVDARVSVGLTFHNYPTAWKWRGRRLPAARLSAVSAALAGAAAAHLDVASDTVTVVPPPIDAAYCRARPRRPHAVVLSPNRLMRKKGVAQLLDVASRSEFAGIRFEFADLLSPWLRPTREHRELRSAIGGVANASLFAPMADPDTLATRYASAGVVVCAAQEPEGLGLVPLEAQATGTPVVTTDAGGLREATFAPNECVPVGDLDALADALMRALNGGSQSEAPRRAVIARHAPEVSAAAFGQWLTAAG